MRLQDRSPSMARGQSKGEVGCFILGLGDPHDAGPGNPHGMSYVVFVAKIPAFPHWTFSVLGN